MNVTQFNQKVVRGAAVALLVGACALARLVDAGISEVRPQAGWWKGNLHTHSLWSDGDNYPEMIADWYKQRGYHFLALSDHNVIQDGERWIDPAKAREGASALKKYRDRFGSSWVEQRVQGGVRQVRLKPLQEYRSLLEEPNRFLMIESEEITDRFQSKPIHMNATNLRELIKPQGGNSVTEVIQNNVNAVLEQRKRTGRPMFAHLNHPNFGWAVTAEDMLPVRGERFFEVYNGHPAVFNYGDATRPGMERLWDILLAHRLSSTGEILYGIAVDDSHHYHQEDVKLSNPGRGWVMVRAASLTPERIVRAMEAGDFYASTGVRLRDIRREKDELSIRIEAEEGVTYTTRFIGTRKGYDTRSEPVEAKDAAGKPVVATRRYSSDIGQVLAEVSGASPSYRFRGDELYVRATITSSKKQVNPYQQEDPERAWVQPVVPPAN